MCHPPGVRCHLPWARRATGVRVLADGCVPVGGRVPTGGCVLVGDRVPSDTRSIAQPPGERGTAGRRESSVGRAAGRASGAGGRPRASLLPWVPRMGSPGVLCQPRVMVTELVPPQSNRDGGLCAWGQLRPPILHKSLCHQAGVHRSCAWTPSSPPLGAGAPVSGFAAHPEVGRGWAEVGAGRQGCPSLVRCWGAGTGSPPPALCKQAGRVCSHLRGLRGVGLCVYE